MSLILNYTIPAGGTQIGIFLTGSGNPTINWGDTSNTVTLSGVPVQYTHTYTNSLAQNFDVDISGGSGINITRLGNGTTTVATGITYLRSVKSFGNVGLTSLNGAFYGANGFTNIGCMPIVLPTSVTDLTNCFYNSNINDPSMNNWNTSAVTAMTSMFASASLFNQNISNWNVGNVANFTNMFQGASAFNNGGSTLNWTLKNSGTITLSNMFSGATNFNQDISWNTDVVTNMFNMFLTATAFNKNCSRWNVSNVTSFANMFYGASAFNNGGSTLNWTLSNSANIGLENMFYNATSFNQDISWNTGVVTTMSAMFNGATAFNRNCSSWNVSNVTSFNSMFKNASAFNNGAAALTTNTSPLTWSLKTSGALKTIVMSNMFSGATSFSQDISSWNIKNVSSMSDMFVLNNTSMTSTLFNTMLNAWAALAPNIPYTPFIFSTIKYTSGGASSLATLQSAPYSWNTTARSVTYTPTSVNWGASFSLVYTVASANSVSGHSYKLVNSNNPSVTVSTFVSTGQASYTFPNVVLQDYNYSTLYIIDNSINAIVDVVYINTIFPCFKEGTKILTIHGYVPIENLRKGDLVKTPLNEYKPVYMIGKKVIYNHALQKREKNQLYVCSKDNYPEVFEDLVITGCHSILVDDFASDKQKEETVEINGRIFITPINCGTYESAKYRLPACVDERATILDEEGPFTIYHISLENDSYYQNYGIYANGLLVETCSKRYLKELSHMNHIDEIE